MEAKYGKEVVQSFGMGGVNYSELNAQAGRQSGLWPEPAEFAKPSLVANGDITIVDGKVFWAEKYVTPFEKMPRYGA